MESNFYGLGTTNTDRPMWDNLSIMDKGRLGEKGIMSGDDYFMADDSVLKPLMDSESGFGTYGTGLMDQFGGLGIMDKAKFGMGAAQLGLGLASFLGNKKTAKLQREDLRTQIASNKELLDTRRKRAANISAVFG